LDKLNDLKQEKYRIIKNIDLITNKIDLLKDMQELQKQGNIDTLKKSISQMQEEIKLIKSQINDKVIY